ncbi:Hypothetical protein A7982_06521 [Minicystis rosea]|nr:Hypothetical protein A7982_06521 [Minicystis rosea]
MTSSREPVIVIARWHAAAESFDRVLALVAELRRQSLEEAGCLGYEVLRTFDEPNTLVLLERYRDGAALEAHRSSSHYRELLAGRILPMLTARRVEVLRACESG